MTRTGVYCRMLLHGRLDLIRKLRAQLRQIKRAPDAETVAEARKIAERRGLQ